MHGGALLQAARVYGIAPAQWLDLSTGINPRGWPVPVLPAACWQRLPQEEDGLERAARVYYGSPHLLPVAGSQAAIQALPRLRPRSRVGIVSPAYAEHAHAWRQQGHSVQPLRPDSISAQLPQLDVLVLINPNNPTAGCFSPQQLRQWQRLLADRDGWLVVDEAFIDATPAQSIAAECGGEGLVVLRSLGKFFGLAGARVGFVLAWPALLRQLAALLGPWGVSGPSREVARLALQDNHWQQVCREQLIIDSQRLAALLARYGMPPADGTALFQYCPLAEAALIHEQLAARGILVRQFAEPPALRFGLPGDEEQWQRLEAALAALTKGSAGGTRSCR